MSAEICVTKKIPNNGEVVMCFGHKTYCCQEDMDEEPAWHEVRFEMIFSQYKLKNYIPTDPEESIFEYYKARECWTILPDDEMGGCEHVIGVTKWKKKDA